MSDTMLRYRVRHGSQTYAQLSPSLLRKPANARKTLAGMMDPGALVSFATRVEREDGTFSDWRPAATRAEVMARFDRQIAERHRDQFQVGRQRDGEYRVVAAVREEVVPVLRDGMEHCSEATIHLHSLVHYQFPKVVHSGDFMFRTISGTANEYSDHAWGTAIDESPRDGMPNDVLFVWLVRMFQTGNADADYVLGSINGVVKSASAPDWDIQNSSAAASHTWHNHVSVVDHDGARPPRNPMIP